MSWTDGLCGFSEDNTPPEIQFQDNEIVYTAGDSYDGLLDGVTATDNKDGDVTESLVVESVYPNEDGQTATIVYVARDSRNNVGKANKVVTYRAAADDQAATSDATEKTATDESADAQPSVTPEATDTPTPTQHQKMTVRKTIPQMIFRRKLRGSNCQRTV